MHHGGWASGGTSRITPTTTGPMAQGLTQIISPSLLTLPKTHTAAQTFPHLIAHRRTTPEGCQNLATAPIAPLRRRPRRATQEGCQNLSTALNASRPVCPNLSTARVGSPIPLPRRLPPAAGCITKPTPRPPLARCCLLQSQPRLGRAKHSRDRRLQANTKGRTCVQAGPADQEAALRQ